MFIAVSIKAMNMKDIYITNLGGTAESKSFRPNKDKRLVFLHYKASKKNNKYK